MQAYKFENGVVTPVSHISEVNWDVDARTLKRTVGTTAVGGNLIAEVSISTVFLGFDHGMGAGGAPVLFETMVFGGLHDGFQERYSSPSEALEGHRNIEEMVYGHKIDEPVSIGSRVVNSARARPNG